MLLPGWRGAFYKPSVLGDLELWDLKSGARIRAASMGFSRALSGAIARWPLLPRAALMARGPGKPNGIGGLGAGPGPFAWCTDGIRLDILSVAFSGDGSRVFGPCFGRDDRAWNRSTGAQTDERMGTRGLWKTSLSPRTVRMLFRDRARIRPTAPVKRFGRWVRASTRSKCIRRMGSATSLCVRTG